MKKSIFTIYLLTVLFLLNNILYSQDWRWLDPLPQGNTLRWVKAFSPTDWLAFGNNGTFLKTTNAGASWIIGTEAGGRSPVTRQGNLIRSAWFFNENTGFVCGANSWLGMTDNGGISWNPVENPISGSYTFTGLYFVNDSIGFMCAYNTYIIKTTDRGSTWTILNNDPPFQYSGRYYCISALDEDHIYAAMPYYISFSFDGGISFFHDSTGIAEPFDIFFADPNTGVVCGSNGDVRITTNSGFNWIYKPAPTASTLYKMHCTVTPPRYSFQEDFGGDYFPPLGWKSVNELGRLSMWFKTMNAYHSAPAGAWIPVEFGDTSGTGGLDWLITPKLNISTGDSLIFWLRPETTGNQPDSLCVRISTTDTALAHFTDRILYLAEGFNYPDTVWTRFALSMNAYAGQKIFVAFKHREVNGDGLFLDDVAITSSTFNSVTIYAAGDTGSIYMTTDLGNNWTTIPCTTPLQYKSNWYSMDFSGSTIVLAGDYGIFNVSSDNGATWIAKNYRVSSSSFYDGWCETGTGKVWIVGAPNSSASDQVVFSSNGGNSFVIQNVNGSRASYKSISMADVNTGYICGNFGAVRKTVNGGLSWDSLTTIIPDSLNLNKIDFIDANTGWVFSNTSNSSGTIWKTQDGGASWIQEKLMDSVSSGIRIYAADMVNDRTGFCINGKREVWGTTNGGDNWAAIYPQISSTTMRDICMLNERTGFICGGLKVFKTTDGWLTSDSVPMPFNDEFYSTKWFDSANGYVSMQKGPVLRTTNGGAEWEFYATSSSNVNRIFAKSIDTAYAFGEFGNILKLEKVLVGITWKNSTPVQYYLGQNYPNPFNPVTQIKFGIAKRSKVSLKVYDITGSLVQTYFDNIELNPGDAAVKFDGRNLASGVYFYTLYIDNNRIDTKKMVLVK